ncbi:MAG: flagellar biosynthesis protein FlhA [Planctomycetaceae bacterium]|nr:flagellar biosynthesis protein FlhA [Planctomycetaceae bacterium]
MADTSKNSPLVSGLLTNSETALSVGLLAGLVVMLVPLPTPLLDGLLACNLGASLLLLMVTLSARQAMELSVFPSLLLLLTLFRLALNVATTRLILLDADAGKIVTAFGNYVVGGQLIVGLVIFVILITIQFMVITKGAGRISEVAARFTLDAMPGKQMAIDAELNAGSITDKEARRRRDELSQETEFYGAMDGASKFVRGDSIAGLIITVVNLLGGVVMGMTNGLSFVDSIRTYSILTVGDGLVSQIPALVIATTAGVLVTKTTSENSLGEEINSQLFQSRQPLYVGAAILFAMALIPDMPAIPFLSLAGGLVLLARFVTPDLTSEAEPGEEGEPQTSEPAAPSEEEQIDEFLLSDRAVIEVGARLVPSIRSGKTKGLSERITTLRKELSRANGVWIPPVRINSNLTLQADEYRILVAGRRVAGSAVHQGRLLAILPEHQRVTVPGTDTTEPSFGLPARWIGEEDRRIAEAQGCTVVDPLSVLITHLGEVLKNHSHELLTLESLKQMLKRVETFAPTVVEEIRPETIRIGTLHQVLVQLAEDRIPLNDLALILEAILNHAPGQTDINVLTDRVRVDLGRLVCEQFRDTEGTLQSITMAPELDAQLRTSLHEGQLVIGPDALGRLIQSVNRSWGECRRRGQHAAFLVDASLRRPLKMVLARSVPDLRLLAYQEVPNDMIISSLHAIAQTAVFADTTDSAANQAA